MMANHVRCVVKIKNIKPKDINAVLNMIAHSIGEPLGTPDYILDFNKIVPEPTCKEDCPEEYLITEKTPIEKEKERPWFNWYEWHLVYWNTKWNAFNGYTIIKKTQLVFVFSTAWSFPYPVIQKLQILNYDIEVKYADENYGDNCGKLTYTKDEGWLHYDESDITNPTRFARDLWAKY